MIYTGHEDNLISFEDGAKLTKKYRVDFKPNKVLANYYSRDSILAALDQLDCLGIRAYFGVKNDGELTLVIVGVDSDGNDQIGIGLVCIDNGIECPPNCSTQNLLNS